MNNTGRIRKSKSIKDFVAIPNDLLRSDKLSFQAKGMLCFLLSLPEDWVVNKTTLQNFSTNGIDSCRNIFNELVEHGYVTQTMVKNDKGQFQGWDYEVGYEPILENPNSGKPDLGKPEIGESNTTNKDNNKQRVKTKKEICAPLFSEVELFFTSNGYTKESAKKAFDHYEKLKWHDSTGAKIKNWKMKCRSVWFRDENKPKAPAQVQIFRDTTPPLTDLTKYCGVNLFYDESKREQTSWWNKFLAAQWALTDWDIIPLNDKKKIIDDLDMLVAVKAVTVKRIQDDK